MSDRIPQGDSTVHIGSADFVDNRGRVEHGGPPQGGAGLTAQGAATWSVVGPAGPGSHSVESLQVDPIMLRPNFSGAFPANGGADAFKGEGPRIDYDVIGEG